MEKYYSHFWLNNIEFHLSVPLFTPRITNQDGSIPDFSRYTTHHDGTVYSHFKRANLALSPNVAGSREFSKLYKLWVNNRTYGIITAEVIVTSYFPNNGVPLQILFKNQNPFDISIKNLIPLWNLQQVTQYWISRLSETEGQVRVAGIDNDNVHIDRYLITESGKVFSLLTHTWRVPQYKGGYAIFTFPLKKRVEGKQKYTDIRGHRIVCYTFNGPSKEQNAIFVHHIDKIKTNNHFQNLRWSDVKPNYSHPKSYTMTKRDEAIGQQHWKSVGQMLGYDFSCYEVSHMGLLRSKMGMFSSKVNGYGYINNVLICGTSGLSHEIGRHRLIAWAFRKEEYSEERNRVDHINGIRSDNRVENLRWIPAHSRHVLGQEINMLNAKGDLIKTYPSIKSVVDHHKNEFSGLSKQFIHFDVFNSVSRFTGEIIQFSRVNERKHKTIGETLFC